MPSLPGSSNPAFKHGMVHTPTWTTWQHMLRRCRDPKHPRWDCYGGRGITVCDRWQSFENFVADMSERPEGTTLDRWPNRDGNYEPGNCRWATPSEQNGNRRNVALLTFGGKTMHAKDWARETGLNYWTLRKRLKAGWPLARALTTTTGEHQ